MKEAKVLRIKKNMRELLKDVRKANRFSQAEFAKFLKLDQSALSRVESDRQEISVDVWIRFLLKTGIDAGAPFRG